MLDDEPGTGGPVSTQELADNLTAFIQDYSAASKTQAKVLDAVQQRLVALEARQVSYESGSDAQDFDAADYGEVSNINEVLPTNGTTDPTINFMRDQLDTANAKIADLTSRITVMEKQRTPEPTLAIWVEDQIGRVNAQNAEVVSRISDVESEITIIKMSLRYGTGNTD